MDLSYSIENLETIRVHPSDHFGLQLFINFRVRTISKQSKLAIHVNNWIDLFESFFDLNLTEDDQENILLPLRLQLCQYERFDRKIHEPLSYIENLRETIRQLFVNDLPKNQLNISIEQIANVESIQYIYLIKKQTDQIEITQQIPIGCVLEPINQQSFNQKQDKYQRISNILEQHQLDCLDYKYLPYGSFRLVCFRCKIRLNRTVLLSRLGFRWRRFGYCFSCFNSNEIGFITFNKLFSRISSK